MAKVVFHAALPDAPLPENWQNAVVLMPEVPRTNDAVHGPQGGMWLVTSVAWEQSTDGTWTALVGIR